ncbi:hypothetical protein H5410_014067 [Solanum commersonii]|uniref:Uncharacterized protein n=1 Tax=Solanum commersonii TaxID=4109 RepID=A0A9J5ZQ60_SOLCO|nr:hypothetical protein H5410_014067 [Solanum commersonii]
MMVLNKKLKEVKLQWDWENVKFNRVVIVFLCLLTIKWFFNIVALNSSLISEPSSEGIFRSESLLKKSDSPSPPRLSSTPSPPRLSSTPFSPMLTSTPSPPRLTASLSPLRSTTLPSPPKLTASPSSPRSTSTPSPPTLVR